MVVRRLLDAVIAGAGLSAGADLYRKAKKAIEDDLPKEETAEERAAREKAEAKAREKARATAKKAEAERVRAEAKTAREVDRELAALKKRMASKKA
jgi:hypothetical protein